MSFMFEFDGWVVMAADLWLVTVGCDVGEGDGVDFVMFVAGDAFGRVACVVVSFDPDDFVLIEDGLKRCSIFGLHPLE